MAALLAPSTPGPRRCRRGPLHRSAGAASSRSGRACPGPAVTVATAVGTSSPLRSCVPAGRRYYRGVACDRVQAECARTARFPPPRAGSRHPGDAGRRRCAWRWPGGGLEAGGQAAGAGSAGAGAGVGRGGGAASRAASAARSASRAASSASLGRKRGGIAPRARSVAARAAASTCAWWSIQTRAPGSSRRRARARRARVFRQPGPAPCAGCERPADRRGVAQGEQQMGVVAVRESAARERVSAAATPIGGSVACSVPV